MLNYNGALLPGGGTQIGRGRIIMLHPEQNLSDDELALAFDRESVRQIAPNANQNYIVGVGGSGHLITSLLERNKITGRVLSMAANEVISDNLSNLLGNHERRSIHVNDHLGNLPEICHEHGFCDVSGIVINMMNNKVRYDFEGWLFVNRELNLKVSETMPENAIEFLETLTRDDLELILNEACEPYAPVIADALVKKRHCEPITDVEKLALRITECMPGEDWFRKEEAFYRFILSLKDHINSESSSLCTALDSCAELLNLGGTLVVVTCTEQQQKVVRNKIENVRSCWHKLTRFPITPLNSEKEKYPWTQWAQLNAYRLINKPVTKKSA